MKKSLLKNYAKLIVRTGANVQKGDYVVIKTEPEVEDFAVMVAEECYKAGAAAVAYNWESMKARRLTFKCMSKKVLQEVTPMAIALQQYQTDKTAVTIWLDADDPDGFKGCSAEKISLAKTVAYKACESLIKARANKYQWVIAGVPSVKWAKKVFPNLSKKKAVEALWEAILKTSRADDGNGIENWERHEKTLKEKCNYLNSLNLRSLHYQASNGTDLTVGLIPGVIFLGGGEKTLRGVFFQPNIPSEECFTSPMRGQAEGVVHASKPLVYNGQVIENFWFRFHEGKVVEAHAEKGEELLKSILTLDEGASYLGECALVPFESPINQTGILFFNTLYDENACCHLAIGKGFTNLYPEFEKYTEDQIHSFGINESLSHVDFMIGTRDLNITGVDKDGKEIPIFRNGTWAF